MRQKHAKPLDIGRNLVKNMVKIQKIP